MESQLFCGLEGKLSKLARSLIASRNLKMQYVAEQLDNIVVRNAKSDKKRNVVRCKDSQASDFNIQVKISQYLISRIGARYIREQKKSESKWRCRIWELQIFSRRHLQSSLLSGNKLFFVVNKEIFF